MKQRTILSTLLLCALLLAGCGVAAQTPDATPTPAPEAAATLTPTPDPLSTLPYTDGQLYAAAYLGYQAPTDLDFFQQTYFGGRELPVHHISDGDFYLIIPRDPNATVRLYKNDMETDAKTLFYEQTNGDAFVIGCNVSDIFPDVTVSITSGGETVDFSPFISLKDGSVQGRRKHRAGSAFPLRHDEHLNIPGCEPHPGGFIEVMRALVPCSRTAAPMRCISRFAACTASVTDDVQSEARRRHNRARWRHARRADAVGRGRSGEQDGLHAEAAQNQGRAGVGKTLRTGGFTST